MGTLNSDGEKPTGQPPAAGTAAPCPKRRRLLFISTSHLGDAVITTGLLAEALKQYGPCEVTVACGPVAAPLFSAVPGLKRIFILRKKERVKDFLRLWAYAMQFYWHAIIDIQNSFVSYLAPRRRAFRFIKVKMTSPKCAQLAKAMKLPKVPDSRIWLSDAAQESARAMLPEGAPILALCPTAGWRPKAWPAERFIELAQRLAFKRVVIFAAWYERAQIEPIVAGLRDKMEVIDLAGKTDALEAAACLARCSLCVANDSGLMHVGAAIGIPTVGIFGPSSDLVYAPHGPLTAVVRAAPYPGENNIPDPAALMQAVTVDSVVDAAKKLMERQAACYHPAAAAQ